jgi:putative tryptophan/tyrosine transport system substrate-binding protein
MAAARAPGVEIHRVEVRTPGEIEGAFTAMAERHVDALIVGEEPLLNANRNRIVDLAATHRLPAISARAGFADTGGLMEHRVDRAALAYRAATYVDKILKGAKPGELPVERPTKYEFVINLKTAQALGLTFPSSFLFRADEVIR